MWPSGRDGKTAGGHHPPGRDEVIVARYEVPGRRDKGAAVPAGTIDKKRHQN
jgi:hypothetical protein